MLLEETLSLAQNAAEALRNEDVIILKNHGVIATGSTVKEAATLVEFVEEIAKTQFPTMITLKIIAGSVKKSPTAAMNGVVILSGSQPPSKLLSEINIVIGSIMIVDTKPAINEIKTKSKMLMLSNPKSMQTPFAITASNMDNTIVKISEAVMFSLKISDLLNSGDNVPM